MPFDPNLLPLVSPIIVAAGFESEAFDPVLKPELLIYLSGRCAASPTLGTRRCLIPHDTCANVNAPCHREVLG